MTRSSCGVAEEELWSLVENSIFTGVGDTDVGDTDVGDTGATRSAVRAAQPDLVVAPGRPGVRL